jgi:hypothetical protein
VVGVACYISRAAIRDLARDSAEGVPDGISTTIFMRRPLNLITVCQALVIIKDSEGGVNGGVACRRHYAGTRTLLLRTPTGSLLEDMNLAYL